VTSPDSSFARQQALLRLVRELEQHVSGAGWDGPVRLFALIRTADALDRDPSLAATLPADVVRSARDDAEHLTAVEQEELPAADTVEELLARIAWPRTVDGAALVLERLVVPPEAESGLPAGSAEAIEQLQRHPQRQDVRMVAAVLRDGTRECALRARDHDRDDQVGFGPDLVPGLVSGLAATLD
jgi:hypothetical protein